MERSGSVVIVDTGILYALADRSDAWHSRATAFLSGRTFRLVVPCPVIPEVCYLLSRYLGFQAEAAFVSSIAGGEIFVEHLSAEDHRRLQEILNKYPSIGFVDAAVVAVAERLGIRQVLTTDRRDFSAVRPRHCKRLELLP